MTPRLLEALPGWHRYAACSGQQDVFCPAYGEPDEPKAKQICRRCPVQSACLSAALEEEKGETQWGRVGVRGGFTPAERARLSGDRAAKGTPVETNDYAEADKMLHSGTLSDTEIGEACGIPRKSISARRAKLGLPTLLQRVTHQSAFDAHSRPVDDGHVEWTRVNAMKHPQVAVHGVYYSVPRLAFLLGHGREPVGHVKATCDHDGCVAWQHLTDREIRNARAAAASQPAEEAAA